MKVPWSLGGGVSAACDAPPASTSAKSPIQSGGRPAGIRQACQRSEAQHAGEHESMEASVGRAVRAIEEVAGLVLDQQLDAASIALVPRLVEQVSERKAAAALHEGVRGAAGILIPGVDDDVGCEQDLVGELEGDSLPGFAVQDPQGAL